MLGLYLNWYKYTCTCLSHLWVGSPPENSETLSWRLKQTDEAYSLTTLPTPGSELWMWVVDFHIYHKPVLLSNIWNMFKFTSCPIVLFMAKSSLPPIRSLFTLEESLSRFPWRKLPRWLSCKSHCLKLSCSFTSVAQPNCWQRRMQFPGLVETFSDLSHRSGGGTACFL